jgi:hypothetical protein
VNGLGQGVNVPNDLGAGGEVVGPFVGPLGLGGGAIVVFAADLSLSRMACPSALIIT